MTTLTGSLDAPNDERSATSAEGARAPVQRILAVRGVATNALAAIIVAVSTVEFLVPGVRASVAVAGLVKPAVFGGEWWRLLSAAYLHTGIWHLLTNAVALFVLGRTVEAYNRASRVWLAFLVGALGGGLASTLLIPTATSVGASGGLLGLAGYLFAVGGDSAQATAWLRKHLRRFFLLIVLYGVALYFMIDNANHAGGVMAGYLLGLIVARLDTRAANGWSRAVDICSRLAALIVVGAALATGFLLLAW